ncbi:PMS1 protein homolog 1 isoform X1 [Lepeophtheirus salmonis]|nr:PMS1 protein homolog 1-like isoform X2 [Lepeophtheirus salmonis]XP_040568853.1 PMS1 protein homolog 1-like isoform X2 [Lepeophtheirus salmonis]
MVKNHYTSKIIGFNDLESLQTYGFRGEALHAILESSDELQILSRFRGASMGSSFLFDSKGNIIKKCSQAIVSGTTITVTRLFSKTPVRRERYTKSSAMKKADLKDIETLILGFSLLHPHIRFLLSSHKSVIFQRPVVKTFQDAVIATLGKSVIKNWVNISLNEDEGVRVEMWVSKTVPDPTLCRSTNDRCFVYVNDRPVEMPKLSRLLKKYLCDAKKKSYPIALVTINVPIKDIDANVEPSKKTVFFKQEESILKLVEAKLKELYCNEKIEDSFHILEDKVVETQRVENNKDHFIVREYQKHTLENSDWNAQSKSDGILKAKHDSHITLNTKPLSSESIGNSMQKENSPQITSVDDVALRNSTLIDKQTKFFNLSFEKSIEHNISSTTPKSKSKNIIDDSIMSKDPGSHDVLFKNNSFISSTLIDSSNKNASFVNNSKEDTINSKMSTLHSWATGKTMPESPPVGMVVPLMEGKGIKRPNVFKRIQDHHPPKKSRSYGDDSLIKLIKPYHQKETIKLHRHEVRVDFDIKKLHSKDCVSKSRHINELTVIGKLSDSEIWTGLLNESIYVLHPSRFREISIYNKLLDAQALNPVEMPYPMIIDKYREDIITLASDSRLSRNGFKVSVDGRYLTHSCHSVLSEIDVDDLFHILDIIKKNPNASLAECRSPKIKRFFQKECMKLVSNCPPGINNKEMLQLYSSSLKYFKNIAQETCFHRKKVMLKIYDYKDL